MSSYVIAEAEVTSPLSELVLPKAATGLALIVRRAGRPVGFIMQPLHDAGPISPDALSALLSPLSAKLFQEGIRTELLAPADTAGFPSLTVAVCTRDRPALLERCLAHLLTALGAGPTPGSSPGAGVEVLVVDNAPATECSQEVVKQLAGVRYVRESRPGLDFARNRAVSEASGELLAFLDDDVIADRDWLGGLREAWAENPDAAAFTGLVLPQELSSKAQILFEAAGGFRRGFEKIRYHGQSRSDNRLYPCGAGIFGAGCNMAFRRDVLLKLGGFDEALDTGPTLPGGGDLDMFYRVVRAGYPLVYEPRYLAFHQHRRERAALRRQYWTWGLGFFAFLVKSYMTDPPLRPRLRSTTAWWFKHELSELVRSLSGRHALPPDMILAELVGGMVGLAGEYQRSKRRTVTIRNRFA